MFKETETLKRFLIFGEQNLSKSNILSKESLPYISENGNPEKNLLYFRKQNFLIFQETSCISGSNFPSSKNKKTHSEKSSYISGNGILCPQKT